MAFPRSVRERAVFVDAAAFYAALARNDQWHGLAVEGFQRLAQELRPITTTNLVISEVHALALARLGTGPALGWLQRVPSLPTVYQREAHHNAVLQVLREFDHVRLSYSDALAFVVMRELGLNTVFTTDRAFQSCGWSIFPSPLT